MTKEDFQKIYTEHFDAIRRYLYYRLGDTELASDITQETFVKIWEKEFYYNPTKTKSLLYKIASDKLNSYYRKNKLNQDYAHHVQLNFKDEVTNTTEETELMEQYTLAIVKLTENEKTVFLMSRLDSLTYKEIAERLDISVKAIEKRMSQALRKLKKEMSF